MYEEIIQELIKVKNVKLNGYDNYDIKRFCKRPNPDRKQLSSVRKWAELLDVPPRVIMSLTKYNDMEEIWK